MITNNIDIKTSTQKEYMHKGNFGYLNQVQTTDGYITINLTGTIEIIKEQLKDILESLL